MIPCPHDCVIIAVISLIGVLGICVFRLGCEWWWRK